LLEVVAVFVTGLITVAAAAAVVFIGEESA
jgi:hypothetical protein